MPVEETNTELYQLTSVIVLIILFVLIGAMVRFFSAFTRELTYLNCEIRRSEGQERKYWLRKRRRLWLSILPFVKY